MLTESPALNHLSNDPDATPRARQLARLVEVLSAMPEVRTELVDDLRRQMADSGYMNEAKLDIAMGLMLRDILR